jgi:phage terminase large subunit-like protein
MFWKPEEHLTEHSNRDFGNGNHRYNEWAAAGHLYTSPGRSINPADVALHIAQLNQDYKIMGLAYDRWRIEDLLREFDRIGLQAYKDGDKGSGLRLVPWGQGFRDMAPAIDALELAVIERKLIHSSNPLLNWNMANALAAVDPSGNRKISKDKVRFRIDGAVALSMLMGLKARDRQATVVDVSTMISIL